MSKIYELYYTRFCAAGKEKSSRLFEGLLLGEPTYKLEFVEFFII